MANPVRVIVHSGMGGLWPAPDYYKRFPWEPSPAGNLMLEKSPIAALKDATLDGVLAEMERAGNGDTVLLVCHAYGEGLLMPVAPFGRLNAGRTAISTLLDTIDPERQARMIRRMASKTAQEKKAKTDAWVALTNRSGAGSIIGEVTLEEVEGLYSNWLEGIAKDKLLLGGPAPVVTLQRLLQRIERVQSLKLDRVELRACDLGENTAAMQKVKELFGCRTLVAPTVGTFYLSGVPVDTLDRFDRRFVREHTRGGFRYPGPTGLTEQLGWDRPEAFVLDKMKQNPGTRLFWDYQSTYIPPANPHASRTMHDGGTSSTKMRHVFAMLVEELKPYSYRGSAATWRETKSRVPAPQWEDARTFVHDYIMDKAAYRSGALTVAGFWTPGEELPWLLPNDPEYVQHIKSA